MLISCTPAEYRMALESLAALKATLERAASAPTGSKLHRGIPYFQKGIQRWGTFLAVHSPNEDSVPAGRPYVESGGCGKYVLRVPDGSYRLVEIVTKRSGSCNG